MPSNICRICKRPLTDYTSIKLGIGPVCRNQGYTEEGEGLFENPHAEFDILKISDDFIYIKDTGHTSHRSVTNDVEFVLSELFDEFNIENKRIFYIDSEGRTDEIIHQGRQFMGYHSGHTGVAL